jgi:predicted deacylase
MTDYAIELDFPNLAAYETGNRGIPWLWTFDSGTPGPHVMVNALTHGNEVCGAIVVKELLDLRLRPRRGCLTLSFANVEAYRRFNPTRPDASRFVDQDFNRVWSAETLDDGAKDSAELRRARELRRALDTVDLLLDLHSMHERSAPLIVCGPLDKGIAFARALGSPPTIISDEGHPEGRRMRDYAGFGDPLSPKNALLIECGQHWEKSSLTVGRDSTARFLVRADVIDTSDLPSGWLVPRQEAPRVIRVTQPVVATSRDFEFAGPYTGLEVFAEEGTLVGWNAGEPIRTPYPNCVLVMPSLRQLRPGVTVARFGRLLF